MRINSSFSRGAGNIGAWVEVPKDPNSGNGSKGILLSNGPRGRAGASDGGAIVGNTCSCPSTGCLGMDDCPSDGSRMIGGA